MREYEVLTVDSPTRIVDVLGRYLQVIADMPEEAVEAGVWPVAGVTLELVNDEGTRGYFHFNIEVIESEYDTNSGHPALRGDGPQH